MQPTRRQQLLFSFKAMALRLRRALADWRHGRPPAGRLTDALAAAPIVASSVTPLWSTQDPAEFRLTAGKIENLRVAVRRLDGREFGPGERFSFWRQLGRPSRRQGYVDGREIREGCVVPSVAGGLCQLSNALYDAALVAGFTMVERHAHSRVIAGSQAALGRDATVFWNYVDLQFKAAGGFRLEAKLTGSDLVVTLRARPHAPSIGATGAAANGAAVGAGTALTLFAASCETCGVHTCFRHEELHALPAVTHGVRAVLVDGLWPEFGRYLDAQVGPTDVLFVPLAPFAAQRFRRARYGWPTRGYARVVSRPLVALRRALATRALAASGPRRQRALLAADGALAASYASQLTPEMTHLVVTQTLLVPLARLGVLGGRTYDVLMTRPPLAALQAQLDIAASRHPESTTLGDFRVSPAVVAEEERALAGAAKVVTPHVEIANRFGGRSVSLPWHMALPVTAACGQATGPRLLFAGPTAGRKGAYEVRDVVRDLGVPLRLLGSMLEGEEFWAGVATERLPPGASWDDQLAGITAVVLPAYVEVAPRFLLHALARGIPVIASKACGLPPVPGLTILARIDAPSLKAALAPLLASGLGAAALMQ